MTISGHADFRIILISRSTKFTVSLARPSIAFCTDGDRRRHRCTRRIWLPYGPIIDMKITPLRLTPEGQAHKPKHHQSSAVHAEQHQDRQQLILEFEYPPIHLKHAFEGIHIHTHFLAICVRANDRSENQPSTDHKYGNSHELNNFTHTSPLESGA